MKCKCGCEDFYIEKHSNNTGLYCKSCRKWQKWLNKDEIRLYEHKEETESFDSQLIFKNIKEYINFLDKEIDNNLERTPKSVEDNVSKCAYTYALEKCKGGLINILEGRRYCDYED